MATADMCAVMDAVRLGSGSYGQVWKVYSDTFKDFVARKYFERKDQRDKEARWFELVQTGFPQHSNMIRMLGTVQENGHPALEMELAAGGALDTMAFR